MILLPAIDILDGKAVRLARGDFSQRTDYDSDPLDAAKRWVDDGARALHVVDLDGARTGTPANVGHIERIASRAERAGAGRRRPAIARRGPRGRGRGRHARDPRHGRLPRPRVPEGGCGRYPEQVVVSVDARDGQVAAAGWTEETRSDRRRGADPAAGRGVRRFVYSNIERDGMLSGPDLEGRARCRGRGRGQLRLLRRDRRRWPTSRRSQSCVSRSCAA